MISGMDEGPERYRLITENIPDAIFLVDLDGRVVFGNRRVAEMTGYSPEELLGRSVFPLLTEEDRREVADRLARVRRSEEGSSPYEKPFSPADLRIAVQRVSA